MRHILGAIAATALLIALAACGGHAAAAQQVPKACSLAIQAGHYLNGSNGTQDAANDLALSAALTSASWPTRQMRTAAAKLAARLTADSGTPGTEGFDTALYSDTAALDGACANGAK